MNEAGRLSENKLSDLSRWKVSFQMKVSTQYIELITVFSEHNMRLKSELEALQNCSSQAENDTCGSL